MATRYFNNKRQSVDVLITSNAEIVIAGNSSSSNIALPTQTLTGASIKHLWCSSSSGNGAYWTIARGNTTVSNLVFTPDSTSFIDFAGNGVGFNVDSSANLVINLVNATQGALVLTLRKEYNVPDDSDY